MKPFVIEEKVKSDKETPKRYMVIDTIKDGNFVVTNLDTGDFGYLTPSRLADRFSFVGFIESMGDENPNMLQ